LFAATVRAPLTGIVLAVELTGNFSLILPVAIACSTATLAAHALGGRPIYTVLLERELRSSETG
jgi:CIC family chloride channel protein